MRYKHQLIDRGDLLKEIDTSCDSHNDSVLWVRNLICKAEVKEPKTTNVRRYIPHNLTLPNNNQYICICNNCNYYYVTEGQVISEEEIKTNFQYCPHCGAKNHYIEKGNIL